MPDLSRLTALLDDFGVTYRHHDNTITIGTNGPKNEGYSCFECIWEFTEDGEFISVGVWE